jgi:hypothetical protein
MQAHKTVQHSKIHPLISRTNINTQYQEDFLRTASNTHQLEQLQEKTLSKLELKAGIKRAAASTDLKIALLA